MAKTSSLSGVEKASLLLIALGTKSASQVLQHLTQYEVEKLCAQVAKHEHVDPELQEQILMEFDEQQNIRQINGGLAYAREVLEQALGPVKAKELLDEIAITYGERPFDWIKSSVIPRLVNCLQGERPQVIALVIAHLQADLAADLLSRLPLEVQGKVAHRLTCMRPVAIDAVRTVEEIIREKLSRNGTGDVKAVGGIESLVTILNSADRATEGSIIEYLESTEKAVAESIKQMLFVFEDILKLDDRAVQTIIRELAPDDMRLSLKGSDDDIKNIFFRNMSERAVEALKEDLELMGPVRRRDVEDAQRKVVAVIRRLDETGEISIRQDEESDVIA